MWKLVNPKTGKIFRDEFASQWEATKAAFYGNGTRIKKAEAEKMVSGTPVYREMHIPVTVDACIVGWDGMLGKAYKKKIRTPVLVKYVLEEY